jgi:hypothetical protein
MVLYSILTAGGNVVNNALTNITETKQPTATPQSAMINQIDVSGNSNTINGYVDKIIIINQGVSSTQRTVNASCCNIFVLKGKNFKGNCFSILKSRIHVAAFDAVKTTSYPSLFVIANDEYVHCSEADQQFYYGFVNGVEDEPQNDSIKIYFELKSTKLLKQNDFNRIARKLGISPIKGKDVLGETGWSVLPIDIKKALEDEGLDLNTY